MKGKCRINNQWIEVEIPKGKGYHNNGMLSRQKYAIGTFVTFVEPFYETIVKQKILDVYYKGSDIFYQFEELWNITCQKPWGINHVSLEFRIEDAQIMQASFN